MNGLESIDLGHFKRSLGALTLVLATAVPASANSPPTASPDVVGVEGGDTVVIDVLANDSDADGDLLSVEFGDLGAHPEVSDNGDGTLTVVAPPTGLSGDIELSYTLKDGTDTVLGRVFITKGRLVAKSKDLPPTASFTYECGEVVGDKRRCTFDGSGSSDDRGVITSYEWTFPASSPPTVTETVGTVSHDFHSGSYVVRLTVKDDASPPNVSEEFRRSVRIDLPPKAFLSASCTFLQCTFDATSSSDDGLGGVTYSWDLGDGNLQSSSSFQHDYPEVGTSYLARLTVTDDAGQTGVASEHVFALWMTTSLCEDFVCDFEVSPTNFPFSTEIPYGWELDLDGDGVPEVTQQGSPSIDGLAFATSGVGRADVSYESTLASSSTSAEMNHTFLVPDFAADCTDGLCSFVALPENPALPDTPLYDWAFGDGGSGGGFGYPQHDYAATGAFRPRLEVGLVTFPERLYARTADLVLPSLTVGCDDDSCSFAGSPSPAQAPVPLSYSWDFDGDGAADAVGDVAAITPSELAAPVAEVTLEVADAPGLRVARASQRFAVPSFAVDCDDLDCTFTASPSPSELAVPAVYRWDLDGDGSFELEGSSEVAEHSYDLDQMVTVTLEVADPAGVWSSATTQEVEIFDETAFLLLVILGD